jgi:glycerol uptake facilitator-like aquaporin
MLTDSFAGIQPADVPPFILAQLAGALAASLVAGWLLAEPDRDTRAALSRVKRA